VLASLKELLFSGLGIGVVILAVLVAIIATIRQLIVIVPPNAVAVITGRGRSSADAVGYRTVTGGRTLRVPIIERINWMSLETIPLEIEVKNAITRGGIAINVQAVANVKIASGPDEVFNNAVERLLEKQAQVPMLARETLSANLRGVLARLTPEEANEDRSKFEAELVEEATRDLQALGLHLDMLKIQSIWDEIGYLRAAGRARASQIVATAEIAEAENQARARQASARARQSAEISEAEAAVQIAEAQNILRIRQAELAQTGEAAERVAKVMAERAEVEAQQELQQWRIELERKRLQADTVEPARASAEAAQLAAQAAAAPIRENGRAQAEALRLMFSETKETGDRGIALLLAQRLPELFASAVDAVKDIDIDRIVVIDGGHGTGVANAASQRVTGAIKLLETVGGTYGIDIGAMLRGILDRQQAPEERLPAARGAFAEGDARLTNVVP
jgi:flotillin